MTGVRRPSPREQFLEMENKIIKEDLARIRRNPDDCPLVACDNSCIVARPQGMATNGGCHCDERTLRRAVQWLWMKVRFLTESMRLMRGQYMLCPHFYDEDCKVCELYAGHTGPHGTMQNVLESHERWRARSDKLETALREVIGGGSITKERAKEISALLEGGP